MSVDLQRWLNQHRSTLLTRWSHALSAHTLVGVNGAAGSIDPGDIDVDTVPLLEALFEATLQAADGDSEPLDSVLLTYGFESDSNNAGTHLPDMLALGFGLARAARQHLAEEPDAGRAFALGCALDAIIEQSTMRLAQTWAERSSELISEREFIASSLDHAVAAADKSALQLKALNDIAQQLSAILERDEILNLVVSSLVRLTGVAHLAVWEPVVVEKGPHLIVRHGSDTRIPTPLALDRGGDVVVRAFCTAQMQLEVLPNALSQGDWYLPDNNVLAFPMPASDRTIGVVVLQQSGSPTELRAHLALIQGVVSQAAIALQNADLYAQVRSLNHVLEQRVEQRTAELQEEKDRLATLHQLATEVSGTIELEQVMETSLNTLAAITQAEHASIMLVEEDANTLLVTRAVLGMPGPGNHTRFAFGSGIAGWVAQHRRPALVPDLSLDERWVTVPGGSLRKREGSMITVPLVAHGDIIGVLSSRTSRSAILTKTTCDCGTHQAGRLRSGSRMHASSRCSPMKVFGAQNGSRCKARLLARPRLFCKASPMAGSSAISMARCGVLMRRRPRSCNAMLKSWSSGIYTICSSGTCTSAPMNCRSMGCSRARSIALARRVCSRQRLVLGRAWGAGPWCRCSKRIARCSARYWCCAILRVRSKPIGLRSSLSVRCHTNCAHRGPRSKASRSFCLWAAFGPLNDTQSEFVSTIYSNTERMIALINDVLDITKIESGSIDLEWRSLHLAEVLSGVVADMQSLVTARSHQLVLSIAPGLPLVRADAYRLHQILYNLLSNAVKYTPRNGQIWVEAQEYHAKNTPDHIRSTLPSERRFVHLAVRDTGVGVSADEIDRIFDRFYRTENPLKVEAGGTGLGLSLVKPLVELLGGRIWAVSELGVGSTFNLLLAT
ncbi:GAF domain-containing protein [Candidatus Gracilibacteria bacterium]|nr:GAF domain-containing protein [Candidatus Gracilibacteria bacterium]